MSNQRNVIGIVLITVCVTSAALVAGYFGASHYFAQQAVTAAKEEPPAPTPAPKRRAPRTKKSSGSEPAAATDAPATAAAAAAPADVPARPGDVPAAAEQPAPVPTTSEPPRQAPVEPAAAEPAPAVVEHSDARAIMAEAQRRTEARSYFYDGLLQSFDASKKVAERRWTFDREGSNGRSKAVVRFTSPPEVKGVALLIHNHPDRASDQWMWTPAIERDRRIATQDRSTRFFGTDFSFEDLEERDVDQYDYALLGSEPIDGAACWKIKSTPKRSRTSQYTHSIAWVRKDNYAVARLDNLVNDDVIRRLLYTNFENVQGIWTARQLEMFDLRRGSRTRLSLQQVKYNAAVKDEEFTLQALRR